MLPTIHETALANSFKSIQAFATSRGITIQQQKKDGSCGPQTLRYLLQHADSKKYVNKTHKVIRREVFNYIYKNYTCPIIEHGDPTWEQALQLSSREELLNDDAENEHRQVPEQFFLAAAQLYSIPITVVFDLHCPGNPPKLHEYKGAEDTRKGSPEFKRNLYVFVQYSTREQTPTTCIPHPCHFLGGYTP